MMGNVNEMFYILMRPNAPMTLVPLHSPPWLSGLATWLKDYTIQGIRKIPEKYPV